MCPARLKSDGPKYPCSTLDHHIHVHVGCADYSHCQTVKMQSVYCHKLLVLYMHVQHTATLHIIICIKFSPHPVR